MSLGGGDLQVILRRIRHGFIICDDTELCDKIISQDVENEQRRRSLAKSKAIDIEKTDLLNLLRNEPDFILDELSHSPEWTATNVQVRRVRCETLGRLDEIKNENEAKRKVQVITWQNPLAAQNNNRNADELIHSEINSNNPNDQSEDTDTQNSTPLFQRRTEPILPLKQPSPLTMLLQSNSIKQNPFAQYVKFDGTPNLSLNQSKKFIVHFQSQKQKLQIIVASHATVEETIGFICYRYTADNREPILIQKDPSKYSLYIADDDGQAEEDFPPLTHARPIGQYDFPHLTLIEQIGTVNSSITTALLKNDEKTNDANDFDHDDNLDDDDDSFDDSSRSITPPPTSTLDEHRKSNSSNGKPTSAQDDTPSEVDPIDKLNRLYDSLDRKTYTFDCYLKSGSNKHVRMRLDVSGEQIRFELLDKTSRLSWQTMSVTTQRLIDCTMLNTKDGNKKRDRTRVYLRLESQQESDGSRTHQTFDFESSIELAEQFQEQILSIIKLKNPQARQNYEQQQQQQQQQQRDSTRKRRSIFNIIAGSSGSSGKS